MIQNLKNLLHEELLLLKDAQRVLVYTYELAKEINEDNYTIQSNLDRIELLTSRFARLSDIIIQKVFRTIEKVELDTPGTTIDTINKAAKRGLIDDEDSFTEVRLLRNEIAHEYAAKKLWIIFEKTRALTPVLLDTVDKTISYIQTKI